MQRLQIVKSWKKNSKRVAHPQLCLISISINKIERQTEHQIQNELQKDIEVKKIEIKKILSSELERLLVVEIFFEIEHELWK